MISSTQCANVFLCIQPTKLYPERKLPSLLLRGAAVEEPVTEEATRDESAGCFGCSATNTFLELTGGREAGASVAGAGSSRLILKGRSVCKEQ